MKVYLVINRHRYQSEDVKIIGVFKSFEEAENLLNEAIKYVNWDNDFEIEEHEVE